MQNVYCCSGMSHDLDIVNQFMGVVHSRVPAELVGPFLERLLETNCPVSFDTMAHLLAVSTGNATLLTVDLPDGVSVRSLPNEFTGRVHW